MSEETQTEQSASAEGMDPSVPSAAADPSLAAPDAGQEREVPVAPDAGASVPADDADSPGADRDEWAGSAPGPGIVDAEPGSTLAAERLSDLQRLQAEYVNYKRRVERDRAVAGDQAVARVVESLLPVLDDIYLARQHGDLEGTPFAAIAEKLDATLAKQGVQRYGQPGEAFDPAEHEALMRTEAELAVGTTVTTVVQVLQPGYRLGDRVLRPARVAVADPQ